MSSQTGSIRKLVEMAPSYEASGKPLSHIYAVLPTLYPEYSRQVDLGNLGALKTSTEIPPAELSDNVRASLTFETLKILTQGGAHIIIINDMRSSYRFTYELLEQFPNVKYVTVPSKVTLSGSKRIGMITAIKLAEEIGKFGGASNNEANQTTLAQFEPEKVEVARGIAEFALPVASGEKLVSVLNRGGIFNEGGVIEENQTGFQDWDNTKGTKNYPGYQAANEAVLNEDFTDAAKVLGLNLQEGKIAHDLLNGVRFVALNVKALSLFFYEFKAASDKQSVDPDRYFNAVYAFYLLMLARDGNLDNLGSAQFEGDNFYPEAQRIIEESVDPEAFKVKRDMQRTTIRNAVALMVEYLQEKDMAKETSLILENNVFATSDNFADHMERAFDEIDKTPILGQLKLVKDNGNIVISVLKDGTEKTLLRTLNADLSGDTSEVESFHSKGIIREMLIEMDHKATDAEQEICLRMVANLLDKQPKFKAILTPMNTSEQGQFTIPADMKSLIRRLQMMDLLALREVLIARYVISKEEARELLNKSRDELTKGRIYELEMIQKTGKLSTGEYGYTTSTRILNFEV